MSIATAQISAMSFDQKLTPSISGNLIQLQNNNNHTPQQGMPPYDKSSSSMPLLTPSLDSNKPTMTTSSGVFVQQNVGSLGNGGNFIAI